MITPRAVTFEILRFKPGVIDPPQWQRYTLEIQGDPSVLDCLEQIRLEQEPGLMYRHCCHHASCGTCGCRINDVERLACVTRISELDEGAVKVGPLSGLRCLGDLVVDQEPFYADLSPDWGTIRPSEGTAKKTAPEGVEALTRLEDCIECACCWSACPVVGEDKPFMGPAALAALNRELEKGSPSSAKAELLALAAGDRGERHCERSIDCSRRCATGVSPARHIAVLRRRTAR